MSFLSTYEIYNTRNDFEGQFICNRAIQQGVTTAVGADPTIILMPENKTNNLYERYKSEEFFTSISVQVEFISIFKFD